MSSVCSIVVFASAGLLCVILLRLSKKPGISSPPPIALLSDTDIFRNTRHAYENALRRHGSIVGVRRKNRLEYIVDHTLVAEVLTNDAVFSFEKGTLAALNLHFLLALPRSFMQDIDRVVQEHIISHLARSIAQVSPVFDEVAKSITAPLSHGSRTISVDIEEMVHHMMAKAMLTLIMGPGYTSKNDIACTEQIASAVATLTGIYENLSWWSRTFPTVWRVVNWFKVMMFAIPYYFVAGIGWRAFNELSTVSGFTENKKDLDPVLHQYARKFIDPKTKKINVVNRIWVLSILLGLIFASVHQTAVVVIWVIFELAKRPEFMKEFRTETVYEADAGGTLRLTYASLRNAERLDSFIREVMRTKGDTLSTVRQTVIDAPIGGYTIPKGSFVIPLATLSNENEEYHGDNAKEFVGDRWLGTGKPAIMTSPTYWPFGLGRWACPGRALAVAEIKLVVLSILAHADLSLENGDYEVVDPLNVISVPPRGRLLLHSRA